MFKGYDLSTPLIFILRVLGRIAFPIFVFLIIEAIRNTKRPIRYLLRILILTLSIVIFHILAYFIIDKSVSSVVSPLIDIFLIALIFYLVNRKDKYSFISIIPILYLVFSFVITLIEINNGKRLSWFLFFLRPSYPLFGLILGSIVYFSYGIVDFIIQKKNKDIPIENRRILYNICIIIFEIVLFIGMIILRSTINVMGIYIRSYRSFFLLSVVPLFFYNGNLGYKKKWFRIFSYLYFPLHLLILYLIVYLISM